MFPLASVEIDVLDETLGELAENISENYDMCCMTDLLLSDRKFNLLFKHVISLPRIMSLLAMYTTRAFLPSIGQVTENFDAEKLYETDDDGNIDGTIGTSAGEWDTYDERKILWFDSTYDRWDQEIFKASKEHLKTSFLFHYNSQDPDYKDPNEIKHKLFNKQRGRFSSPHKHISIPFFKRRRIIPRPFNKNDEEGD